MALLSSKLPINFFPLYEKFLLKAKSNSKVKRTRTIFPLMSNQRKMLDEVNMLLVHPTRETDGSNNRKLIFLFLSISIIFNFSFSRPKTSPFVAYRRMFESSWEFVDGPGGGSLSKSHQCLMYTVQRICSNRNWYEILSTFYIMSY